MALYVCYVKLKSQIVFDLSGSNSQQMIKKINISEDSLLISAVVSASIFVAVFTIGIKYWGRMTRVRTWWAKARCGSVEMQS